MEVRMCEEYANAGRMILKQLKVGVQLPISRTLLEGCDVRVGDYLASSLADELCLRLTAKPYGQEDVRISHHEVPETWWDAFKLAYFPEWLLLRFPAKFTRLLETKYTYYVCPHAELPYSGNEEVHLNFFKYSPYTGEQEAGDV
jgi:hypothetical protein